MSNLGSVEWNRLLIEAKTGDSRAVNQMFEQIKIRLQRVASYRLWGERQEEIEDIIQNTLVVFTEKWQEIESNPHLFAVQILHNKIYHSLRDRKNKRALPLDSESSEDGESSGGEHWLQIADETADPTQRAEANETAERIKQALLKLAPFCQKFFLALFEEQTIAEIWSSFQSLEPNLKRSAFDKRIFDCRRRLRAETH